MTLLSSNRFQILTCFKRALVKELPGINNVRLYSLSVRGIGDKYIKEVEFLCLPFQATLLSRLPYFPVLKQLLLKDPIVNTLHTFLQQD